MESQQSKTVSESDIDQIEQQNVCELRKYYEMPCSTCVYHPCIKPEDIIRKAGRQRRLLTYKGKTLSIYDWSKIVNIPVKTIFKRLNEYRWSVEETLGTPPRGKITHR